LLLLMLALAAAAAADVLLWLLRDAGGAWGPVGWAELSSSILTWLKSTWMQSSSVLTLLLLMSQLGQPAGVDG
jgi:hypothetical protein